MLDRRFQTRKGGTAETIFFALAVLACPLGMGLMMWFMAKGMGRKRHSDSTSLGDLRAEQERIAELQGHG